MDINAGPETIEQFYKAGLIRNIADLYEITQENLLTLERWKEKSTANFIESVKKSTQVPFGKVLYAIGIRFIGETVAKRLANAFHSIDNLINASYEQLIEVDEIGDRIAQSVLEYFSNKSNLQLIERLKEKGVQLELGDDILSERTNALQGQTFVISGTFSLHSRDEYKALIEKNGGKNTGSVSSKTNFILAGENMGPAKLEKAEKLGVKIINEEDFLAMLK